MDAKGSPVFLLGCSWRCGSTLLQRVLNSSGSIFIWGEQAGLLNGLVEPLKTLELLDGLSDRQKSRLEATAERAWIANINPRFNDFKAAVCLMLRSIYETPTKARGIDRWGFKEVRYDAHIARLLLDLYPNSRVIFLVRNPFDVLASNAANDWYGDIGGATGVALQWKNSCESFLTFQDARVLLVKYEELIHSSASVLRLLSDHLSINQHTLTDAAIKVVVRGAHQPPTYGRNELEALEMLKPVAASYGYRNFSYA